MNNIDKQQPHQHHHSTATTTSPHKSSSTHHRKSHQSQHQNWRSKSTTRTTNDVNSNNHGSDMTIPSSSSNSWRRKPKSSTTTTILLNSTWKKCMEALDQKTLSNNDAKDQEEEEQSIVSLIDSLLSDVTYPDSSIDTDQHVFHVLNKLTCIIQQHTNQQLVAKFCQLITLLISKQKISVGSAEQMTRLLNTIIQQLKHNSSQNSSESAINMSSWMIDCMRALSFIVSLPGVRFLSSDHDKTRLDVIHVILDLDWRESTRVSTQSMSDTTRYYLLNCIDRGVLFADVSVDQHAANKSNSNSSQLTSALANELYDYLLFHLCQLGERLLSGNVHLEKHVSSVLKSMSFIVKHYSKVHVPTLSKQVYQLKKLICYGTPFSPIIPITQQTKISHEDAKELHVTVTSGSDVSDSEQSSGSRSSIRIRLQSLQLLSDLSKADFKSMFGEFKNLFLSSDSTSPLQTKEPSLFAVMLYDGSPRCRSAAVQAIIAMLENSKLYLAQADDTRTKSSFVSFSRQLAFILHELHRAIIMALDSEKSTPTVMYILKCLATLIQNTSYDKLSMRFMRQIVEKMLSLIETSSDRSVQNIAFSCLAYVFDTMRPLKEVEEFLTSEDSPLNVLLSYLDSSYSTTIRTECAQVMLSVCSNYPNCINQKWNQLCQIIQRGLGHSDQTLRLILVQIVNNYTAPFADVPPIVSAAASASSEGIIVTDLTKPISHEIWLQIIDNIIAIALNDEFQSVRASACLIYSNMSEQQYLSLTSERRKDVVDRLVDGIHDEAPAVKAASCKAIGSIVLFQSVREDISLLSNIFADLKPLITSSVLNVRVRSSWTIANVCDAIRQSSWCSSINSESDEGYALMFDIIRTLLHSCNDNDKVICNIARAFGNICVCAPLCILQAQLPHSKNVAASLEDLILAELVACIKSTERTVKPRWNACYAIGGLLSNKHVSTSEDQAFDCLCDVIRNEKNFKVRIQASAALAMAVDFGSSCGQVLSTLLSTFNCEENYPYKEYKYLKTLNEQAQKSVSHLMSVTPIDTYRSQLLAAVNDRAEILASCVVDAINQPGFYDSGLLALRNTLALLENDSEHTDLQSVEKAIVKLKKRLLLEQQIQSNIL